MSDITYLVPEIVSNDEQTKIERCRLVLYSENGRVIKMREFDFDELMVSEVLFDHFYNDHFYIATRESKNDWELVLVETGVLSNSEMLWIMFERLAADILTNQEDVKMTKTIKVYHSERLRDSFDLPSTIEEAMKTCKHVSTVTPSDGTENGTHTEQLNEAYYVMQSLDVPWWENTYAVEAIEQDRSSSVGDVFVIDDEHYYIVANVGFKKLN